MKTEKLRGTIDLKGCASGDGRCLGFWCTLQNTPMSAEGLDVSNPPYTKLWSKQSKASSIVGSQVHALPESDPKKHSLLERLAMINSRRSPHRNNSIKYRKAQALETCYWDTTIVTIVVSHQHRSVLLL